MKLQLDTAACQGHGRCYSLAPKLFDADGEGHSILLHADIRSEWERSAKDAVESCPEEAITLDD